MQDMCKHCDRPVADDGRQHDGSDPCWIHVDNGLHSCSGDIADPLVPVADTMAAPRAA